MSVRVLIIAAAALIIAAPVLWFGGLFAASELHLRDVSHVLSFDHPIPTNAASLERGRHIARTRGCFGCHGQRLEGWDFDEQWDWPERAVAPNLAAHARAYEPDVIEAAVRRGVGHDGRALTSMPSYNFTRLSDEDLAALIGFLQSAPVVEAALPTARLGWSARWSLLTGSDRRMSDWVALVPALSVDADTEPQLARGEYLAMTMCNECHGLDVRGQWFYQPPTPDLAIAPMLYSRAQFERLIETGVAADGRELGLMALVAPDRFPDLSDTEVDDLYAYLASLQDVAPAENVAWRPLD